jgi:hypothetical protein
MGSNLCVRTGDFKWREWNIGLNLNDEKELARCCCGVGKVLVPSKFTKFCRCSIFLYKMV